MCPVYSVSRCALCTGVPCVQVCPGVPCVQVYLGVPCVQVCPGVPCVQVCPGVPCVHVCPGVPCVQVCPGVPYVQVCPGVSRCALCTGVSRCALCTGVSRCALCPGVSRCALCPGVSRCALCPRVSSVPCVQVCSECVHVCPGVPCVQVCSVSRCVQVCPMYRCVQVCPMYRCVQVCPVYRCVQVCPCPGVSRCALCTSVSRCALCTGVSSCALCTGVFRCALCPGVSSCALCTGVSRCALCPGVPYVQVCPGVPCVQVCPGVPYVQVCYGPTACLKASDPSARQRRATLQTGGAVTAAVASTDPNVTNNPPRITTAILTIRIFEEESFSVQLAAVDEDDDKLTFVLNPAFSPRGEVTLSYLGLLIYKPCLDCVGEDVIHFTVREQRTDGVPALSVDGEYKVVIEGVNDNPQLLLLVEGASALPPSHELAQSMEENQPGHGAYRDLLLLVAVSDPDPGDTLTLKMEPPSHGTLTPYAAVTTVHVVGQDCNSSWEERRGAWDAVLAAVQDDSVTSVVLPAPCGGAPLSRLQAMSWALTAIRYTPTPAYYGTDTIKVGR